MVDSFSTKKNCINFFSSLFSQTFDVTHRMPRHSSDSTTRGFRKTHKVFTMISCLFSFSIISAILPLTRRSYYYYYYFIFWSEHNGGLSMISHRKLPILYTDITVIWSFLSEVIENYVMLLS